MVRRHSLYVCVFTFHLLVIAIGPIGQAWRLFTEPKAIRTLRFSVQAEPEVIKLYQHLTGAETGYAFFAPNVPDSYNLRFEVANEDGTFKRLEVNYGHDSLRIASLLDYLGRYSSGSVREYILKLLVRSLLRRYSLASRMRIVLERLHQPTIAEYLQGKRVSATPLCVYDFGPTHKGQPAESH